MPSMVRWSGMISGGRVTADLVGMPDIYRTILSVAGAREPEHQLDGHDLTDFLTTKASIPSPRKEYLYFRRGLEAIRVGDWKLRTSSGTIELFHMVTDPFERINRAPSEPDTVARLTVRMREAAKEAGVEVTGL